MIWREARAADLLPGAILINAGCTRWDVLRREGDTIWLAERGGDGKIHEFDVARRPDWAYMIEESE